MRSLNPARERTNEYISRDQTFRYSGFLDQRGIQKLPSIPTARESRIRQPSGLFITLTARYLRHAAATTGPIAHTDTPHTKHVALAPPIVSPFSQIAG